MCKYIIYCKDRKEDVYEPVLFRLDVNKTLEQLIMCMEKYIQFYPRNKYKIVDCETGVIVYK